MEDFRVVSTSMSSSKFTRLVRKFISFVNLTVCLCFDKYGFLLGDISLMPEVSVDLVCNLMEGIN